MRTSVKEQLKLGYALSCPLQKMNPSSHFKNKSFSFFMFEQIKHLIIHQYIRSGGSLFEIDRIRSTTFLKQTLSH